jgi:TrpR-related protein YerC/YecD
MGISMTAKTFTEHNWRKDPAFKALCEALASCKTPEAVADFLRDIGTLTELQAWSERLEVARLLAKGKTYREIAETTGASTTTVTRVARFLQGGEGGYRRLLQEGEARKLK